MIGKAQPVILFLLICSWHTCISKYASVEASTEFPQPQDEACHVPTNATRVCNPDLVLTFKEVLEIEKMIHEYFEYSTFYCCIDGSNSTIDLQMGVYIEQEINNDSYHQEVGGDAEVKATAIHNEWGIGYDTECGGSGVLIYIALEDHQMYISRGRALEKVLNDAVLREVIDSMVPYLRRAMYAQAIEACILDLTVALQRKPREKSSIFSYFVVISVAAMISTVVCCVRQAGIEKREREEKERLRHEIRQKIEFKLKEMDQLHSLAEANKFYMARSCPICLETFPASKATDIQTNKSSNSGEEYNIHNVKDPSVTVSFSSEETPLVRNRKRLGADGLPLRLLTCGHVFDETCISDWIGKSSAVPECPICRAPIEKMMNKQDTPKLRNNFLTGTEFVQQAYNQERRYRLGRLREQYPDDMTDLIVEDWTADNYNGSLYQDFIRYREGAEAELRQLRAQQREFRGDSGDNESGFGGGSADGGGVGGSW